MNERKCARKTCTRRATSGPMCKQHGDQERALGLRGRIDNRPLLRFIAELVERGFTAADIAEQAGVSYTMVYYQMQGCRKSVLAGEARKIMAIDPNIELPHRPKITDDSTTFARRVHALACMGWSSRELARRMGYPRYRITDACRRGHVARDLSKAMRELYEELWNVRGPSSSTATHAKKLGYAPPMAWDDIDDLYEIPTVGNRAPVVKVPVDELKFFKSFGLSEQQLAERFDTSVLYVRARLKEAA